MKHLSFSLSERGHFRPFCHNIERAETRFGKYTARPLTDMGRGRRIYALAVQAVTRKSKAPTRRITKLGAH